MGADQRGRAARSFLTEMLNRAAFRSIVSGVVLNLAAICDTDAPLATIEISSRSSL
jgi:hypothetical protein